LQNYIFISDLEMNYNYLTAFTLFIDVTQTFRHGYVAGFADGWRG